MHLKKARIATAGAAAAAFLISSAPANARGCNGVVNPLVWGCAPWDNNNGPQYAYYRDPKTKQIKIPMTKETKIRTVQGQQQVLHNGQWLKINSQAAGVVSAGGLN